MKRAIKKVLVFSWGDRWSTSITTAFKKIIDEVETIYVNELDPYQIETFVEKSNADLCFAKNFRVFKDDADRAKEYWNHVFESWKFPMAMWYLDNPVYQDSTALRELWEAGKRPKNILFYYNDPSFSEFFTNKNMRAHHLPIGVDEVIFQHRFEREEPRWQTNLRFSGHPLAPCELPEIDLLFLKAGYLSMLLSEVESELMSESSTPHTISKVLHDLEAPLQKFFSDFYTQPDAFFNGRNQLYRDCKEKLSEHEFTILKKCEGKIGSIYSWWQLTSYLFLLQDKGIIVQGSEDWQSFFPKQKEKCRELQWEELFASYAATKISFCFTKWSLPHAVHDRIYEVYAAGGFPLTDFRSELKNHFKDDEIAVYRNIEEAKDLIDYFLKHDSQRLSIMEKGQQRVRSEHTYRHRLKTLLEKAEDFFY